MSEKVKNITTMEMYIKQIMRDMKNGVMAVDKQGKILYANPQMSSYFEEENISGTSINTLMLKSDNKINDGFWDTILDVTYQHTIHNQKKVAFISPSGVEKSFHVTSSYLRDNTDEKLDGIVITVSDETEYETILKKKHDASIVLISMLLLVCITVLVSELHAFLDGAFPHTWIARSTEILGFVILAVMLKFTSLTVKDFAIFPTNIKKELFETFIVVAVMVLGMSVAKIVVIHNGSTLFPSDKPFFDFTAPPNGYYFKYIAIVLMQEVMTKCGLQKNISKVLDGKYADVIAVFITSVMFMALHVQHGLIYMLGAGLLSAVLAIMYSRHNSLLGSSIIHYTFGIMGLVLQWIK